MEISASTAVADARPNENNKNASGPGDLPEFESFDNASFVSQFNCLKDKDKARTRSRDENETPLTYKYNVWEGDAKR